METTIEKLNQNRLMELTEQDYENINNNAELKSLFLQKIKEGHKFSFDNAGAVLEEELLKPEYITIILDALKDQHPEEFIAFFFSDSKAIIEQFEPATATKVLEYIKNNMHYVLSILHGIDQQYEVIQNPEIIADIINNKLEKHYGSICMAEPTKEFEDLLIDALSRNEYKYIHTINPNILRKCLETNNIKAAMFGIHPENKEESEIIFYALEQGLITYTELLYTFTDYHKDDPRLFRQRLRNNSFIHISEEEYSREEIRKIIIEEVEKNHNLANEYSIKEAATSYPEIALLLIKYWNSEELKNMINYKSKLVRNALKANPDELINSIIYNLENNQSSIEDIINEMFDVSNYNPELACPILQHPKFFNYYASKIEANKLLKLLTNHEYYSDPEYYIKLEFYELLANANISFSEIPKNFNYKINYPENIWLAIIPLLNDEQLVPSNIYPERFVDLPRVFDCILLRLKELKSNVYNVYLESWKGEITDTLIDIVCSKENPLNISAAQKLRILPSYKMFDNQYLFKIIENEEVINYDAIRVILPTILSLEDIKQIKKLLSMTFAKLDFSPQTVSYLTSQAADVYGTIKNSTDGEININEQYLIFYHTLENFLKTQKNIPLTLTSQFPEEVAQAATYSNLEALANNPDLFKVNGIAPHHFTEFITECQKKGLPINLKLLHQVAKRSVSIHPYDYENITYSNDDETYEILYSLLNLQTKDSIKRKVVTKWINNCLDYKFFDCQTEQSKKKLMELIVLDEEYMEKILEVININNIKDSTVLSTSLLSMLISDVIDYPEKKHLTTKIYDTIMNLIAANKMNTVIPDITLKACLRTVNDPIFINYIKENIIRNIPTNIRYVEELLGNQHYKQATLEALNKNKNLATHAYITRLIKTYPEIKQYVKEFLEHDENEWTEFNENYYDTDLLKAYLNKHSIDKIITFIVHNQNLSYITPQAYAIIKENLLKQHTEFNKESYNILEQFYGLEILLLLETNNLKILLTKDEEVAKKFTEIFKERNLDENIITSISDSFRQNYFNIKNTHIINFYTNTLEKIQRGITEEEIKEVIDTLINYIPANLEKEIEATDNELLLNTYKTNKLDFLTMLIHELIKNQNTYAALFNKITNNLIVQKRNEYRSTQDIYVDTNLNYELDTKSLYNVLFNYFAKNDPNKLIYLIEFTEYDTDLNLKTIQFLSGQTEQINKEEIPAIKRNIPRLKEIIISRIKHINELDTQPHSFNNSDEYEDFFLSASAWSFRDTTPLPKKYENLPRRYEYLLNIPEFKNQVKKIPIYPEKKNPLEMIGNVNITVFEQLAKDENKYQALLALLNKYRFLEWNNLFEPTVKKLSIGEDNINLFNFINAFSKIYDNEKKIILRERKRLIDIIVEEMKRSGKSEEEINNYIRVKESEPINIQITAYKILKYSTIYSSIANYYKIILGMEDFELVKRNDGPNSSHRSAEDRLSKASQMQLTMMELNEVTVPSFIYEHELKSDEKKKLAVTVGNRADSRNLTHGERTGACMRAYGHADSLFEFCNTDPRGFHITFTDPETNEYVSRVSCFRNGNTVFLNQLRNTVNPNYSTEDVIEACYAVAQELIERSKDSEMPIDNVVASTGYALAYYETQQVSPYNNISTGVYNGYRDVSNFAVVLATTGENGKVVPLKPNGDNQPIYEPVRLQPREYISPNITESVKIQLQRISSIKECLENKSIPDYYKTIDFDYEIIDNEYIHVIIGQDWYVALDVNGNLTHDIAVQNEHSIEEFNEALAKLSKIKEDKQKIGGFTNGI